MLAKGKKTNQILLIGLITFIFIGIVFFLLRGPYLSNSIKRLIIPVLENATHERIIIDKAVINLFPFYLQAKGVKVFDKEGNRILWITKARAYIDVLDLFSGNITIRRLTLKEPNLKLSKEELKKVIHHLKKYLSTGGKGRFSMSLKNVKLRKGRFKFIGNEDMEFSGDGLFAEMLIKDTIMIKLSLKEGLVGHKDFSKLRYRLDGKIKIKGNRVRISSFKMYSSDSVVEGEGEVLLSPEGMVREGRFSGNAKIFIDTITKFFGLRHEKHGMLSFSGSVNISSDKKPVLTVDLKTEGQFYVETLMKILKVNKNLRGMITVNGRIQGVYPHLSGEGNVEFKNAILGNLSLNKVMGRIEYKDKKFSLHNFIAYTYDGEIRGDASLVIPSGDYSIKASISDINSPDFFKFIKWKAPFPEGKIVGNFYLVKPSGKEMEITAAINYINTSISDKGPLNRLEDIKTDLYLKGKKLRIKNSIFSTSVSKLFLKGDLDLYRKTLYLKLLLKSKDISDLTAPYFNDLKTAGRFKGKAWGHFSDPQISGNLRIAPGNIKGFSFTSASATLTYNIKNLYIKSLRVNQKDSTYNLSGTVIFRKARRLFSFGNPFFRVKVDIKDGNIKSLLNALYKKDKDIPISGVIDGNLSFIGDLRKFNGKGNLVVKEGVIYGQQWDKISVKAFLSPTDIKFQTLTAYKNRSKVNIRGRLFFDKRFNISISSDGLRLQDFTVFHDYPVDALLRFGLQGSGTFEKPDLRFSVDIIESYFKDREVGKGKINGSLKNRSLLAKGSFLNGMVSVNARADLSKPASWTIETNFKKGRYDTLLAAFLKELPQNVSASVEGTIKLKTRGRKIRINSKFTSLELGIYGYNFRNIEDIILELVEKELRIKSFSLTGENADISVGGVIKIGKNFDVTMKGDIDITPVRVVSKKIMALKGRGEFIVKVTGTWERPETSGKINVKNVAMKLAGFPHRIGPLNGSVFLNGEKVIFDSFKGDFAGGTILISGAGYLRRLGIEKLFISSVLTDIKLIPVRGIRAIFDGRLFYETSAKGSTLTGDIKIKRAIYKKKIKWRKWLLGLKEIKKLPTKQPTFLGKTVLNIRIRGSKDIAIDNNVAKTPVKIDLTITGTIARYGLIGRIESEEGTVYFRGNEFKILKGSSVDFMESNAIIPVFHIHAETFVRSHHIRLSLDGTMDEFTLSLFSDPPLPEMDILTLLTFGQVSREAKGFESGVAAGEATAILTGKLQDEIEEKFKYITGFERFEVEPHTTATGALAPKVTVGKRFLNNKLSVIYSTSVGTTEEHIFKLEYKLGKNISIVGSRNEIGSTGGDIKYRFKFK